MSLFIRVTCTLGAYMSPYNNYQQYKVWSMQYKVWSSSEIYINPALIFQASTK